MEKENTLKLWISPQKQNNILQKQKIILEKKLYSHKKSIKKQNIKPIPGNQNEKNVFPKIRIKKLMFQENRTF